MRVFVFFSGGASAMKYLIEQDPNCGKLYKIVGSFTNRREAPGLQVAEKHDIPTETIDEQEFYEQKNQTKRETFYRQVLETMLSYEPDLIILSGYMDIITYPIIESEKKEGEFTNKVLNIHPADLGVMKKKGTSSQKVPVPVIRIPKSMASNEARKLITENNLERAYKGEDAVTDALLNGAKYTQSTCHIAQRKFDAGPIVTQSKKFPVKRKFIQQRLKRRDWRSVVTYGKKLQEEMKWKGDGPAYAKALEIIAKGRLTIGSDDFTLFLDEEKLPYCGLQLSKE